MITKTRIKMNRKEEIALDYCNTCGEELGTENCLYQSLKDKGYMATKNKDGEIIQECCANCIYDMDL